MKIEDTVCTLEQSKKLAELGVELDTLYVWDDFYQPPVLIERSKRLASIKYSLHIFAAPTTAELGMLLPVDIENKENPEDTYYLEIYNFRKSDTVLGNDGWLIVYCARSDLFFCAKGIKETQVRADALIWLIENRYVKAQELKL